MKMATKMNAEPKMLSVMLTKIASRVSMKGLEISGYMRSDIYANSAPRTMLISTPRLGMTANW